MTGLISSSLGVGQHWFHHVCTSLALVDVRKFQHRRVKLSLKSQIAPHLWGVSQGRQKTHYEEGCWEIQPFSEQDQGKTLKSLRQFFFLFLVSQPLPGGMGMDVSLETPVSVGLYSKTTTQGTYHILLHLCYFPRLAHHVLWIWHRGKGKDRATPGLQGVLGWSAAILEEQTCKFVWSMKPKLYSFEDTTDHLNHLVFVFKTSIEQYRKEWWNSWC